MTDSILCGEADGYGPIANMTLDRLILDILKEEGEGTRPDDDDEFDFEGLVGEFYEAFPRRRRLPHLLPLWRKSTVPVGP
jgi:hypothetical protein